jgi:hypothetical protein
MATKGGLEEERRDHCPSDNGNLFQVTLGPYPEGLGQSAALGSSDCGHWNLGIQFSAQAQPGGPKWELQFLPWEILTPPESPS